MLAFPTLSSRRARRASDGSVVCAVTRTVHRDARARRRDRRSERPAPAGRAHQDTCVLPARRHADRARTPTGSARPQTQSDLAAWRGGRSGDRQTGASGVRVGASRARRVECRPTSARARRTLIAYSRNNPHRYPTIGAARAWPRQASIRFGDRPGTTAGYGFSTVFLTAGSYRRPRPPLHALPATASPHRSALDDACRRSHRGARGAGAFRRSRTDRATARPRTGACVSGSARSPLAPRYGITAAGNAAVPRRASYFVL